MTSVSDRLGAALADRYRLERELGQGGMATVYLAHDLRHDRQVAIKVLRPELAAVLGAERFVVEIKTTAALQHPHILPLFDSGSADGFLYYVMPYVEGETLRTRLDREKQLGIEEAVKITTEVADALDYAHRHGVIHRDIKPENILLHDGRPMVADFGIALAVSAAAGGRMTETGMSLGTPHYMSPEQATAEKEITGRSDIYSLASVLYEMLTGNPPHTGASAQQIIMKIIAEPVAEVTSLRKSVPPNVAAAVGKALEKLPADRFESAKAFAEALGNPAFALAATTAFGTTAARPALRRNAALLSVSAVAAVTTLLALWGWLRPAPPAPVTRFAVSFAPAWMNGSLLALGAAISPDGSAIAYVDSANGHQQLFLRRVGDLEPQPLAGTGGAVGPFFSPDGAWIGFLAGGQVKKVPIGGGTVATVADSAQPWYPGTGTWLDDGTIVFQDADLDLRRVSAAGGPSRVIVNLPRTKVGYGQTPLPHARGVLFNGCWGLRCGDSTKVYVWDARRDTSRLLFRDAFGAWYAPPGYVVYMTRQGTLMAVPWDNDKLTPSGPAVPIMDGIQAPGFLLSASGTALYILGPSMNGSAQEDAEMVWVDRAGHVQPVDSTWRFNTGGNGGFALSPDGGRLAIRLRTDQGENIWIKQLPAGPPTRLTFATGEDRAPQWAPDGRTVTFLSDRPAPGDTARASGRFTVWSRAADGTGTPKLLWQGAGSVEQGLWSPDGPWLILSTEDTTAGGAHRDILAFRPGADSVARPLLADPRFDEWAPAISPDSRWIAYLSDETGTNEVFVRPFPDVDRGKTQISSGGAGAPLWAHHGHELVYWSGDNLVAAQIHPGPPFGFDSPQVLFAGPDRVRTWTPIGGLMDIAPDDRRFLMVRDAPAFAAGAPRRVVVEQNFFTDLRTKMGTASSR
jgi:eukaryotic-like serine/threonine-protein kinase